MQTSKAIHVLRLQVDTCADDISYGVGGDRIAILEIHHEQVAVPLVDVVYRGRAFKLGEVVHSMPGQRLLDLWPV